MANQRETILEYMRTYLTSELKIINGYNFDIAKVYRTFRHWDRENELPVLCILDGDEDITGDANEQLKRNMHVLIIGYVQITDRDDTVIYPGTCVNKLLADVINALYKNWSSVMLNANCRMIKFTRVQTDLGMIYPKGAFELSCDIEYVHELGHA